MKVLDTLHTALKLLYVTFEELRRKREDDRPQETHVAVESVVPIRDGE